MTRRTGVFLIVAWVVRLGTCEASLCDNAAAALQVCLQENVTGRIDVDLNVTNDILECPAQGDQLLGLGTPPAVCRDEINTAIEECGGGNVDCGNDVNCLFEIVKCMLLYAEWMICVGFCYECGVFVPVACNDNGGWEADMNCNDYSSRYCLREKYCQCPDCSHWMESYDQCVQDNPYLNCKAPESCPPPASTSARRYSGLLSVVTVAIGLLSLFVFSDYII
eukprot:scaffold27994_cov49-Attheya_sp.AAC.3